MLGGFDNEEMADDRIGFHVHRPTLERSFIVPPQAIKYSMIWEKIRDEEKKSKEDIRAGYSSVSACKIQHE